MPHPGTFRGPAEPEDLDALLTADKSSRVAAINEVLGFAQSAEKVVHVAIGLTGPVVVPALPVGAKITGVQVNVTSAYPVSTVFNIGDHSGTSGALAAAAVSAGAGITATSTGNYNVPVYVQPVGNLNVTVTGGDGSTGAATVLIRYING